MNKKFITVITMFFSLFLLVGCDAWNKDIEENSFVAYGNRMNGECYIRRYYIYEISEEIDIMIPEYLGGYKCTMIGRQSNPLKADFRIFYHGEELESNIQINLHISKFIQEIAFPEQIGFYETEYSGSYDSRFENVTFFLTCDEEDETFYAENGKLYFKTDDSLVEFNYFTEP